MLQKFMHAQSRGVSPDVGRTKAKNKELLEMNKNLSDHIAIMQGKH